MLLELELECDMVLKINSIFEDGSKIKKILVMYSCPWVYDLFSSSCLIMFFVYAKIMHNKKLEL